MLRLTQALALSTIVAALASAAPAIGYVTDDGDRLAPRREGPTGIVIRRDGASAVRFAPAASPLPAEADDSGFDFGDAAIGAGAGIVASLLAVGGVALVVLRRPSPARTLTS